MRELVQPIIQGSTQNISIWQKQNLKKLNEPLQEIYDAASSFINSKDDVVKNSLFYFV